MASWARAGFDGLLIGDEVGVKEAAEQFGFQHIPFVQRSDKGVPLVSALFETARRETKAEYLVYLNADIVVTPTLLETLTELLSPNRFITARRRNLPMATYTGEADDWNATTQTLTNLQEIDDAFGSWDQANAIDLFVFHRDFYSEIPDFAIGRMSWDTWLLSEAAERAEDIIDISALCPLFHPIHGYSAGWREIVASDATAQNRKLAKARFTNLNAVTTHRAIRESGKLSLQPAGGDTNSSYFLPDPVKEYRGFLELMKARALYSDKELLGLARQILYRNNRFVCALEDPPEGLMTKVCATILDVEQNAGSPSTTLDILNKAVNKGLIHALNNASQSDDVLIWGTGSMSDRVASYLALENRFCTAFIETSPKKDSHKGQPLLSPHSLAANTDYKGLPILIASVYAQEIEARIKAEGLEQFHPVLF